jgi:hypothetical protein
MYIGTKVFSQSKIMCVCVCVCVCEREREREREGEREMALLIRMSLLPGLLCLTVNLTLINRCLSRNIFSPSFTCPLRCLRVSQVKAHWCRGTPTRRQHCCLQFSIVLEVALCTTQPLSERSTRNLPGGKERPPRLENVRSLTHYNPIDLHALLYGWLYFYYRYFLADCFDSSLGSNCVM